MQSLSLSLAPSDNQLLLPTDSGTEPKWAWQGQGSRHDVILLPQALPGRLQWSATVDQEGGCGQGAWPHKEHHTYYKIIITTFTCTMYVHCYYTHFSVPPPPPPPSSTGRYIRPGPGAGSDPPRNALGSRHAGHEAEPGLLLRQSPWQCHHLPAAADVLPRL